MSTTLCLYRKSGRERFEVSDTRRVNKVRRKRGPQKYYWDSSRRQKLLLYPSFVYVVLAMYQSKDSENGKAEHLFL